MSKLRETLCFDHFNSKGRKLIISGSNLEGSDFLSFFKFKEWGGLLGENMHICASKLFKRKFSKNFWATKFKKNMARL